MWDIDDGTLERMSLRELLELQTRIHEAIRAHIRLKNAKMAAIAQSRAAGAAHLPQVEQSRLRSLAVHAKTRPVDEIAPVVNAPSRANVEHIAGGGAGDLERERDNWLNRKRSTAG